MKYYDGFIFVIDWTRKNKHKFLYGTNIVQQKGMKIWTNIFTQVWKTKLNLNKCTQREINYLKCNSEFKTKCNAYRLETDILNDWWNDGLMIWISVVLKKCICNGGKIITVLSSGKLYLWWRQDILLSCLFVEKYTIEYYEILWWFYICDWLSKEKQTQVPLWNKHSAAKRVWKFEQIYLHKSGKLN